MDELLLQIRDKSNGLIELLGFSGEPIVTKRESIYFVNIIVEDSPSYLIGRGGETLEAVQHILRIMLLSDGIPYENKIVIDINGYRNKRTSVLEKKAREIAHRVRTSGKEEVLSPMNSFERRLVHTIISNIADVESESSGERESRRVVVRPGKAK